MKTNLYLKVLIVTLTVTFGTKLFAGDITLDPSQLVPADTGYYIGGADKDENKDGVMEHYNGCYDAYGDASHNESAKQQGFLYHRCMIMPTCDAKDSPAPPVVSTGYIELTKTKYLGTDSAVMGYIITPAIKNLSKLYMETSSDVKVLSTRTIPYIIEFSIDTMRTWDTVNFVKDLVADQKGYIATYEQGGLFPEFDKMIEASKSTPIVLRISSGPQGNPPGPQRVKVHKIIVTADLDPGISVGVKSVAAEKYFVNAYDKTLRANRGKIMVYSQLGQLVGYGNSVTVKTGLYLVKTANGQSHKVLVK